MPTSPLSAPEFISAHAGQTRFRRTEDVAYQAVTVAAILMVLGSIWVF